MTRALLPLLGWATSIAGLSMLMERCGMELQFTEGPPPSLTYALESDGKLRLRVSSPDERLYLRAHLELPEGAEASPEDTWVYGLGLTFLQPDGNFQRQNLWLRSRLSTQEDGTASLLGPRSDQWVTDGRLLELDLQDQLRAGGKLEIKPLLTLADSRLLLRVERRPNDLEMRLPWEGGAILAGRVGRYSALPWLALEREEIRGIWRENRVAIAAEQLVGKTVEVQRVSPALASSNSVISPTELAPGQATALTLQGPCSVRVEASPLDGGTLPPDWAPEVTVLRSSGSEGLVSRNQIVVPADEMAMFQWTAPEDGTGLSLRFSADAYRACIWGQPGGQTWESQLSPEARRFTAWSGGPEQELVLPVATGRQNGLLTVEARPMRPDDWSPLTTTPPTPLTPVEIRYFLEDDQGNVLREGKTNAVYEDAPLDHRIEPEEGPMSAPTRFTIQHPFDATQLRIQADEPVDFRFLVPLPVEEERASAYALPGGWVAQNAPWELAPYIALSPINADELLLAGRLVRFDATVIPVKRQNRRPEGQLPTHKLEPDGDPPQFPILEQVRRPGPWKPWHRTELGRSNRLKVPASGSLRIEYRSDSDEPGVLSLSCGGVSVQHVLPAGAGALRLNKVPSGWVGCTLDAPPGRYLADTPGSGRRWARRSLVQLEDDQSLNIPVQVPKGGSSVFVRLYTPRGSPAPTVEIKVDQGRPRVRSGLVEHATVGKQRARPPSTSRRAYLLDSEQGQLRPHQGVLVVFGDDLRSGPHSLQVRRVSGSGPVYVRFDSATGLPSDEDKLLRNWYVEGAQQ